MKDLTKWRQAVLTENELIPAVNNKVTLSSKMNSMNDNKERFYPKKSKPYKKRHEETSLPDQVAGTLNPIVYKLNKGQDIKVNSQEHKWLKELLEKINTNS